jgi:hypothetical protein
LVAVFADAEVEQSDDEIVVRSSDSLAGLVFEQRIVLAPGGAFRFFARLFNTGTELATQ